MYNQSQLESCQFQRFATCLAYCLRTLAISVLSYALILVLSFKFLLLLFRMNPSQPTAKEPHKISTFGKLYENSPYFLDRRLDQQPPSRASTVGGGTTTLRVTGEPAALRGWSGRLSTLSYRGNGTFELANGTCVVAMLNEGRKSVLCPNITNQFSSPTMFHTRRHDVQRWELAQHRQRKTRRTRTICRPPENGVPRPLQPHSGGFRATGLGFRASSFQCPL